MSSISQFGIPGVSTGILQPNLRHRFRVTFHDRHGDPLSVSDQLAAQVIEVGAYNLKDPLAKFGMIGGGQATTLVFQDDIANNAAHSIIQLSNRDNFTVRIDYLDGANTVIRTVSLTDVQIAEVQFDKLSYAGTPPQSVSDASYHFTPNLNHRDDQVSPLVSELSALVDGIRVVTETGDPALSSALRIFTTLTYANATITFPNKG